MTRQRQGVSAAPRACNFEMEWNLAFDILSLILAHYGITNGFGLLFIFSNNPFNI